MSLPNSKHTHQSPEKNNSNLHYVSLNLLAVEIELDAKIVLSWVFEDFNSNLHHASLIMDCRPSSTKFFNDEILLS